MKKKNKKYGIRIPPSHDTISRVKPIEPWQQYCDWPLIIFRMKFGSTKIFGRNVFLREKKYSMEIRFG